MKGAYLELTSVKKNETDIEFVQLFVHYPMKANKKKQLIGVFYKEDMAKCTYGLYNAYFKELEEQNHG